MTIKEYLESIWKTEFIEKWSEFVRQPNPQNVLNQVQFWEKAKEIWDEKIIEEAKKSGKIPAQNDDLINKYKTMIENDFDSVKVIIDALPTSTATPPVKVESNGAGSVNQLGLMGRNVNPELMDSI